VFLFLFYYALAACGGVLQHKEKKSLCQNQPVMAATTFASELYFKKLQHLVFCKLL